jgi:hypothetical protein
VVQYGERGHVMLTFPPWTSEFAEATEIVGYVIV